MRQVHTSQAIRRAEQDWFSEHPGEDEVLMQRAAREVTRVASELVAGIARPKILVVAGTGNNAGDALFAAALVPDVDLTIWAPFDQTHRGGLRAALRAGGRLLSRAEALLAARGGVDLVIDGLFGIGSRPGLPESVTAFAEALEDVRVVAVDLPSGLDADSGQPHPCLPADATVTFIAPKTCHVVQPAAARCGRLVVADIGVDARRATVAHAWQASDLAVRWPVPGVLSDKYSRGVVGLDTGSAAYPGAGLLSTIGALHAGAGMVRHAGPVEVTDRVLTRWPSVVIGEGRVQAWVCGSGWGDDEHNAERLARRLDEGLPTVIDADALRVLPDELPENCLLTPHAGELARLLEVEREAVTADPIGHAQRAADRHQACVLLKGATQVVATPGARVVDLAVPGPAWTAQAGSGDVLAGICGALLASGLDARTAAVLGASVQAVAAAQHPGPWTPDELAGFLPEVIGRLVGAGGAEPKLR